MKCIDLDLTQNMIKPTLIDDVINTKVRSNYRGISEWVVAKPIEAYGLLRWKIKIVKAFYVLTGKADAFRYSKY